MFDHLCGDHLSQKAQRLKHSDLQGAGKNARSEFEMALWAQCFSEGCWHNIYIEIRSTAWQHFVGINVLRHYRLISFVSKHNSTLQYAVDHLWWLTCQLIDLISNLVNRGNVWQAPISIFRELVDDHVPLGVVIGEISKEQPGHSAATGDIQCLRDYAHGRLRGFKEAGSRRYGMHSSAPRFLARQH